MQRRRLFVLLLLGVLALAVGYLFGRSSASKNSALALDTHLATIAKSADRAKIPAQSPLKQTVAHIRQHRVRNTAPAPLPPPGTPLAQIHDELKARADAGDVAAASRLYYDVRDCFAAKRLQRTLPRLMQTSINLKADGKDSAHAQVIQEAVLRMTEGQYKFAQQQHDICAGLSDDQIDSVTPIALRAANLGDARALGCYVGSNLDYMPGLLNHPEWLIQFKQNALALAQHGVTQGNWLAVHALTQAYLGNASGFLLTQATGPDPTKAFAYMQLEKLGNPDARAAVETDRRLALAAEQLTPEQQADAETWAQDTYAHFFGHAQQDNDPGFYPGCWGH